MEPQKIGRHTAFKVWINDLHKSDVKVAEEGFSYLGIGENKVVRMNLFGSVIDKFVAESYATIIIDDSSGNIRLRVWADDLYMLENSEVGDLLIVVGRWAEYDGERYLRPELVRKISVDWALLRRLELNKTYGAPSQEEKIEIKEEVKKVEEVPPTLSAREVVLNLIEKYDEISYEDLLSKSKADKNNLDVAVQDLLKEGEIFSPKKDYYRLV